MFEGVILPMILILSCEREGRRIEMKKGKRFILSIAGFCGYGERELTS